MLEFFMTRLECLFMGLKQLEKNEKVFEIIKFAHEIMRRKTYRQLIRGLQKDICPLLGFSEVGILFHDTKSNISI